MPEGAHRAHVYSLANEPYGTLLRRSSDLAHKNNRRTAGSAVRPEVRIGGMTPG
jgi:hypothetical protein